MTCAGASAATFTVRAMAGYEDAAASASERVHTRVASVQFQPPPVIAVAVRHRGQRVGKHHRTRNHSGTGVRHHDVVGRSRLRRLEVSYVRLGDGIRSRRQDARQNRDAVTPMIGYRQIGAAVAIEVAITTLRRSVPTA